MNLTSLFTRTSLSLFILVLLSSCGDNGQAQTANQGPIEAKTNAIEGSTVVENAYDFSAGVRCGLLDKDGILWFGTNYGVFSYNGTSITNFSEMNGICNQQVTAITEDRDGNLWFGTADGLCKYDRKTFTHIPIPWSDTTSVWLDKVYPIMNPNAVHSLIQDRTGDLWIGTCGAGAYRYDGEDFTSYLTDIGRKQEDSLYHNWIPSIAEDVEGNIWFASMTHGGASRFDGENFTHFMPDDGLTDDMVRTIFSDKSGNLWFGFNGNRNSGLSLFDGMKFVNYYEKDGLCDSKIRAIYEDENGHVWLGADLGVLCVYDGKTFEEFKTPDGKTVSNVNFILEDATGNIWMGGRHGLRMFDGEEVTDLPRK